MINEIKHFCTALLLLASSSLAFSQTSSSEYGIKGRIIDNESGESLPSCNVMLMTADTTKMVAGAATNSSGAFHIKDIKKGNFILKVTYIGFKDMYRSIKIEKRRDFISVGTLALKTDATMLETAVIEGKLQEVTVKDDTVLFNAAAYKVPEGSVLEELVKKLPGAEVEEDGSIKINGKSVSKILVEGKEFFSNDRSMAMKNIPTDIVDKIKTYEKKSDLARITGIDDGQEETVIDLTIKKGMKNGWFGNLNGGAGTEDRYTSRFMVNRFQDKLQASLIGNLGNTGGGGTRTNGQTGLNLNIGLEDLEIGGNVRYNWSKNNTIRYSSSQNFITTNSSFSNSYNRNVSRNKNVGSDFKIEWKPDTLSRVLFRPSLTMGNSDSEGDGLSATFNADPFENETIENPLDQFDELDKAIKINRNANGSLSESENWSMNGSLLYNRRLSRRGRNISINLSGNYNKSESKNFNMTDATFYQRNDSTSLTYRYRTTPNENKSYSAGFTYSEPLADDVHLQLNYSFNYNKRESDGITYDIGKATELRNEILNNGVGFLPQDYFKYEDFDLSRYTNNTNKTNNVDLQLRINREFNMLNVGVSLNHQNQKVDYNYQGLDTIASRNFLRISPTLNYRYRFSRQHQLQVRYRGNTQQPEITDMFAMTDNSNPLNIREGNPGLKPSFTNNINISYNNYIIETNRNITANISLNNTLNSISSRTQYNEETGGRITRPENINGNWSASGNFGFRTPIFTDKLTINTNTSTSYSNNVGYIYQNNETLKNNVKNLRVGERLSLTWREEYFDVVLNGSLTYNNSRNEYIKTSNRDTYDFNYGLSSNANLENGFGFSTSINMSSRRGYSSADMNTNELIWNAQVSYRFLEGRRATVSLQANDILQQRSNISRTISATMRSDSRTNSINSYVMLNFSYRFGKFGGRNGGGRQRGEFTPPANVPQRGEQTTQQGGNTPQRGGTEGGRGMGGFGGGNRGGGMGGFR